MLDNLESSLQISLGIRGDLTVLFGHDGGDLIGISSDDGSQVEHVSLAG